MNPSAIEYIKRVGKNKLVYMLFMVPRNTYHDRVPSMSGAAIANVAI
jgi:hypothetical protein